MTYPLVRDLAVDGIPVTVTCRVLKFSTQAFYAWCADPVSERDLVDAYAMNAAFEVHRDDPGFGYRFIADELAAAGHEISERRVWKICSQAQIVSAHARTRGRWKKPGPPVHDDLVERDFTATGPNRLWLTDITEHATAEGKLYLCAVKDCGRAGSSATRSTTGCRPPSRLTPSRWPSPAAARARSPAAWCTPIGAASSVLGPTSPPCTGPDWSGRWDGWPPARTTPRWSPSSPSCRRTS